MANSSVSVQSMGEDTALNKTKTLVTSKPMDPGREIQAQSLCQGIKPTQEGRKNCQNGTLVQYGKSTGAKRIDRG